MPTLFHDCDLNREAAASGQRHFVAVAYSEQSGLCVCTQGEGDDGSSPLGRIR